MADDTRLELLITAQSDQFKRELAGVNSQLDKMAASHKKSMDGIGAGFKSALPDVSKFALGAGAVALAFDQVSASIGRVIAKETALAQFSALTGVTGDKLKEFGIVAEEMAVKFGTTAVDNIESFKGVLSRLGPDFAKSTEAVKLMGENINILAKASGLDATAAMDALTTAMLQFGVDLKDPNAAAAESTRMMNTMAAAAKEGAAEIPQIAEALKQTGVTAKNLNQTFEGVNAALQILAAGGKTGSEAGVALRNTMSLLVKPSKEAGDSLERIGISSAELGRILTTKGLDAAMKRLGEGLATVGTDADRSAIMFRLFGQENATAAQILVKGSMAVDGHSSALAEMERRITGTTSAQEQADVVMETSAERLKKLKAQWDSLLDGSIEAGLSAIFTPFNALSDLLDGKFYKSFLRASKALLDLGKYSTLGAVDLAESFGINAKIAEMEAMEAKNVKIGQRRLEITKQNIVATMGMGNAAFDAARKEQEAAQKLKDFQATMDAPVVEKAKKAKGGAKAEKKPREVSERELDFLKLVKVGEEWKVIATEMDTTLPDLVTGFQAFDVAFAESVDNTKGKAEAMKLAIQGIVDTMPNIAQSLGSALLDGVDPLKAAMKQVLNAVINGVQGLILAAAAASAGKAITTFGISLITDAPLLAAAFLGLEVARGFINSFAVGTSYIPNDQLAQVHRGEMIVPATFASSVRRGEMSITGGTGQGASARVAPRRKERVSVNQSVGASSFRSVVQNNSWREASRTA